MRALNSVKMLANSILNFEIGKIETNLREKINQDVEERKMGIAAMNLSIVGVIRALISRSETDYNLAILQLKIVLRKCSLL